MKYLKSIKLFESNNDINDIKDICLELEDEGFTIVDYIYKHNDTDEVRIIRESGEEGAHKARFKYKDVDEVVTRLKRYLGGYLVKIDVLPIDGNWTRLTKKEIIELDIWDRNILAVSIEYRKHLKTV